MVKPGQDLKLNKKTDLDPTRKYVSKYETLCVTSHYHRNKYLEISSIDQKNIDLSVHKRTSSSQTLKTPELRKTMIPFHPYASYDE